MSRIRLLRVLLPLTIVVFLTVLALQLRPPTPPHSPGQREGGTGGTNIDIRNLGDPDEQVRGTIDSYARDADGAELLEGVREFELKRPGKAPLVVSATKGRIVGSAGEREMHFNQGVVLQDPQAGVTVELPELDVDEQAAVASTDRPVQLTSPSLAGSAEGGLVYSLADEPTRLRRVDLRDDAGGRARAELALMHDGSDDIEMLRSVSLERGEEQLEAERIRATREAGRFRRAVADGAVRGRTGTVEGRPVNFRAESADILWGDAESIERAELQTDVELTHLDRQLRCDSLEIARREDGLTELNARGSVVLDGSFGVERGRLTARTLDALLDASLEVRRATAAIDVRFEGEATRAEAERARYDGRSVELLGSGSRKARLARQRMRVGAERIESRVGADDLSAEGSVEATLLPQPGGGGAIFRGDDAIHFVATRLDATGGGDRLIFNGNVRGWQGERNLAADRVEVERGGGSLVARGSVESRMPRDPDGVATVDADFVTIRADTLDYDDARGLAVYRDEVAVLVSEGRIDAELLEVRLDERREIDEIVAAGEVRVEWSDDSTSPPTRTRARADRLIHRPAERVIWLIGETRPAEVEREGERAGTTTGQKLRYDLVSGSIEVEAGSRGPARIRSEGGG